MRLHEVLFGLKGIAVIADDILVYGFGETEKDTISDNDRHFKNIISSPLLGAR